MPLATEYTSVPLKRLHLPDNWLHRSSYSLPEYSCHVQLVVISEGFDSSMWESLETAEMLSASVMDPSFYSKDAKEIAAASGKVSQC